MSRRPLLVLMRHSRKGNWLAASGNADAGILPKDDLADNLCRPDEEGQPMNGVTAPDQTGKLQFDTDRGASRSKWIARLLALALIGWMAAV
jgi:hypothetical protein